MFHFPMQIQKNNKEVTTLTNIITRGGRDICEILLSRKQITQGNDTVPSHTIAHNDVLWPRRGFRLPKSPYSTNCV